MTTIEKIRLLIGDTTVPYHFADAQIQAFYDMAGSVMLAAALALESWATTYLSSADSEHIGDYSYSKKVADNMLKLAQRYRENESTTPAIAWAEPDLMGTTEDAE